ncbi:MAG: hypothetical protein K2Q22_10760, partial [Cytophagales bacterium]|nr:hypothetical protein [Cytophagales bacterium]
MHDPQYRVAISWQNSAYNQPPHLSYYLGSDMATPAKPNITIVGGSTTAGCSLGIPGTITGLTNVCASATGVYSIAAVASATGYRWTLPTGAVIASGNSNSVSIRFGNTSGMVQVQPFNACGTSTGVFIYVNVAPVSIAGIIIASSATTVCSGTGVVLTATGVNTGSAPVYSWFKNNTLQTTGRTYSFVPAQGDQIKASLTIGGNGTACITNSPVTSTGITLTVNPVLTPTVSIVSSVTTLCSGAGVSFTATGVNGGTAPVYAWFKNNVLQSTGRNYTYVPAQGDQVRAVLTVGGTLPTCLSITTATSAGIALTVNPILLTNVIITASSNSVCSGTGVIFTATGTNGGSSPT